MSRVIGSITMTDGIRSERIPDDVLNDEYHEILSNAYRSLREAFAKRAAEGWSQDEIAARLGVDKSLVSRRLNGRENLTLRTLSQMATGLDYRLFLQFVALENLVATTKSNFFHTTDRDITVRPPRRDSRTATAGPKIEIVSNPELWNKYTDAELAG